MKQGLCCLSESHQLSKACCQQELGETAPKGFRHDRHMHKHICAHQRIYINIHISISCIYANTYTYIHIMHWFKDDELKRTQMGTYTNQVVKFWCWSYKKIHFNLCGKWYLTIFTLFQFSTQSTACCCITAKWWVHCRCAVNSSPCLKHEIYVVLMYRILCICSRYATTICLFVKCA